MVIFPRSAFSIAISAGVLGTATGSGAITGVVSTDLTFTPTNVSTVGGTGSLSVANFTAPGLHIGVLAFDDLHITLALPATTNTAGGPTVFNPDLGGTIISVDNGQMIEGTSTLFDFSKTPIIASAPSPSLTTLDNALTYIIGHQEYLAFDWTIPFTAVSTFSTLGIPANITIGMNLEFGAIDIPIPEPGTLLLLGAGVAGLAATRRRRGITA